MQKQNRKSRDNSEIISMEARRRLVGELLQQNLAEVEIAARVGVDVSTVSRDISALKTNAMEWVYSLAKDSLAHMYKQTFEDLNRARLAAWDIYNKCNQQETSDNNNNDVLSLARLDFSNNKQHNQHKNRDQLNALKVVIQSNVAMLELLQQGPTVMAVKGLNERVERLEKAEPKAEPIQQEVSIS